MTQELIHAVNKQVANWTVLYVKLHHYHWFVKGHHFFTLHEKFEELYDEANG
ncbi:MAG TPA: ferritin-like domain-containing protein, partial [Bacillus sp. (in: firmicutes)]|nr:ferritin-like domain-containing protein [Bacillus sp. (in: firmicutes)]